MPRGQAVLLRDHAKQWMEDKKLTGLFNGGEGGEKKYLSQSGEMRVIQTDRQTD